ncbi:GNAT family N-acetyltransferase [Oceanitalea stevensii]|uniref:N-acetyltransferase n=1 Tax=Oceanitalea stevensii TaxID=2763072 RepID=A0ABR8Z4X1_9MICO|nr:N-acetyltransferase [Oceanitalea stevensii]MBD8063366.1 N-acetyltransferase [Oceanitalea stevensii]
MPFPAGLLAPDGLTVPGLSLRPITAADAELDHAAVMESRELLRPWEQTGWPADDFTVAENRADLEGLERRHAEGRAFTYTVLDPADTTCLGCVYLMPPDARMYDGAHIVPAAAEDRWEDVDAAVYFWVRASRLGAGTDRVLLEVLRDWLRDEWGLEHAAVVVPEDVAPQVAAVESTGLRLRFTVTEQGKPGRYLAYG